VGIDLKGTSALDVPLASLPGGKAARVRVTVNDGFRAASAESAPFALPAAKSTVRILDPTAKSRLRTGESVVLHGEALTPLAKHLKVTWFAGKHRLGRGDALALPAGLPGGRVKLRLVASDGASARVTLRVKTAAPVLTVLQRRGRTMLRVAASVPAKLRLGGRSYAVGPAPRVIAVHLRGKHPRGTLTAGGKRTGVTL
jgi:hypothetical protein